MEFIQQDWNWAWATLAAVSGTLLLVTSVRGGGRGVSPAQATQLINREDAVVIDVREADEFAAGHLPGAVHIARGLLEFKLSGDPGLSARDLKLVVYCKTGGRAALAACTLHDMGYLHVKSIAGGFDGWAGAGKPVAKPSLPNFD